MGGLWPLVRRQTHGFALGQAAPVSQVCVLVKVLGLFNYTGVRKMQRQANFALGSPEGAGLNTIARGAAPRRLQAF